MHWYIIGVKPSYYLNLFWSMHVVSKDFIFKKSTQGAGSACCQEWRNLWHCTISKIFMSCYITFKKKTSTYGSQVGHMWVTSGLFCGSVGQMGHQVWPTFNPGFFYSRNYVIIWKYYLLLENRKENVSIQCTGKLHHIELE